jgi:hypothetical protein
MPEKHQLFIKRVMADKEIIQHLENIVSQFLREVEMKIQQLESLA